MYTKDKKNIIYFRISNYDLNILKKIAFDLNISTSILCRNIIKDYISKLSNKGD